MFCSLRAGDAAWSTPSFMYHIFEPSLVLESFYIYFYFFMVLCVPLYSLSTYRIYIEGKYSMFFIIFCVSVARPLNIIQISYTRLPEDDDPESILKIQCSALHKYF